MSFYFLLNMFSKKILRVTLLSLLAQLVYMSVDDIPDYLIRPFLIIGVVIVVYCFYLYTTWSFTEEKVVEKIAEHRDEPLADLHAPTKDMQTKKDPLAEVTVSDSVTNT